MKTKFIALLLVCGATASAQQLGNYLGPGVLTRGASDIGQRSGQDVDLRFYANAMGIYDTGMLPVSTGKNGGAPQVGGLYGVQVGIGAYGRHTFRKSVLGLDYNGNYRHYQNNTFYNGTNQQLALGYTLQQSRRVILDFRGVAGTASYATAYIGLLPTVYDSVVNQNSLLYDNRMNYFQGGTDVTYLLTSRTSITAGGSAYAIRRRSSALVGLNGYSFNGAINHRLSQRTSIGVTYQRQHYDYPSAFGQADMNVFQLTYSRQLNRAWVVSLAGGIFLSAVQGQQRVSVDPAIAALLGIGSRIQVYSRHNVLPSALASLTHNWQHASISFNYQRGINAGNGVYLTSRMENYGSTYSYTGIRKWSFSLFGNHSQMSSLSQNFSGYAQYYGGSTVTYALTHSLNISASYMLRHADTTNNAFRRDSSRTSISIYFSPGNIPISFR